MEAFEIVNRNFHILIYNKMAWIRDVSWNYYLYEKNYYNDTLTFPDMENIRSLISNERENINNVTVILISFNNQKHK